MSKKARRSRPKSRMETLETRRLLADVSPPAFLQWFDSSYDTIENRTSDIFAAGYGAVWLPPPGRADSGNFSVGYDVYDRFDLGAPRQGTLYGTETGIRTVADNLHRANIDLHIDAVINHNGFSDQSTFQFAEAGGYPGFLLQDPDGDGVPGVPGTDGDFNSAFDFGDIRGRLSGLIDIDHGKNFRFIRNPVPGAEPVPGDHGGNLPPGINPDGAGRLANIPDEGNRRFYPDRDLDPIFVFDPATGDSDIPIYPFNTSDPTAGDPIGENATGLLMRYLQWMVQDVGVDGFRIDAAKHVEGFAFNFLDRAVYRQNPRLLLDGSPKHVFSYGEVFDGNREFLQSYVRKDIDPNDLGRVGGNRDVLDFAQYFTLHANLTDNGFNNDWNNVVGSDLDTFDDGLRNGSSGVKFVQSHDEFGPALNNVAHAYMLMMPGNAVVYFNGKEFGDQRDFPKAGRGDALGGVFGDAVTTLNGIRNSHGRGNYVERWLEKETFIYERSGSAVVGLSNRTDGGFDERRVDVNLPWGTYLVELTGNASNSSVDPNDDIPEVIRVDNDCFECQSKVTLRVPRNSDHGQGYVVYGLPTPQAPDGIQLTNVASVLAGETPAGNDYENGRTRLSDLQVIQEDSFDVSLQTVPVNLLGSIRDAHADGDNAMLRLDGGLDVNGNGFVDVTQPGSVAYGFEQFVTKRSDLWSGGDGEFVQTIDATQLSEGPHFLEVIAFRHRDDGGEAVYSSFKESLYVDRLPPDSTVLSFEPFQEGVNENRDLIVQSLDKTADSVHVFLNLPAGLSDAQIMDLVGQGQGGTQQIDRDQFVFGFFDVPHGNNVATIVTFEQTGTSNIQRVPGLFTNTIVGAGLGDVNHDGSFTTADVQQFSAILDSDNTQFDPAADMDGNGLVDFADLFALRGVLENAGAGQDVLDEVDGLIAGRFEASDDQYTTDEDTPIVLAAPGLVANDAVGLGNDFPVSSTGTFTSLFGASVTLNADGSFEYNPLGATAIQSLNTGDSLQDEFTYTITDGAGTTDTATVLIHVAGIGGVTGEPQLTVNGTNANYTTTKLFLDETSRLGETIQIDLLPGATDVAEIEIVTNLNQREFARQDANQNGIEDGMEWNQTDGIISTTGDRYYRAHPMTPNENGGYSLALDVKQTGAFRLTARWRLGDDDEWTWYTDTASNRRDHAITVSPQSARSVSLYELNPLTIEAAGNTEALRSTFEDLYDAPNAARTGDGLGVNLDYISDLGANWLWLQPIHPNGIERRQIDPDSGQPYSPGSPYAVKNFFDVNPILSVENTREGALQAFQEFVAAADAADIGIMLDAPFNHTSPDVELGLQGVSRFAPGAAPNDEIREHEGRFFSNVADYGLPADVVADGFEGIAVAPDRGDFGKWSDVDDVFFGQYSALVRQNPQDNGNINNEEDQFYYSEDAHFTSVTQNTWGYFADYILHWLDQTGYPQNPDHESLDVDAGVDGLRADFAQGLPPQAWEYIINVARSRKWDFVVMAESLDGGPVTYRSNRHFDILNENIVFALQGADSAGEYRQLFEQRRQQYGEGLVLLNTTSHDEEGYADPYEALIRHSVTSTIDGVPMVFMGQELGTSRDFGFDEYEVNFGKNIPHFKRYNSLGPIRAPANRNFGLDQLDDVYSAINFARQTSPALQGSQRYFLNQLDGSTHNEIYAVAKYEVAEKSPAISDVIFAFANLDRNNGHAAVFDVDIDSNGSNLFGIDPTRLYNVVNIAAYTGFDANRRDEFLWPADQTGQEILDSGIFVGLNGVPTEDTGPNGWDQAPFEAQYLKLIDVTPDPTPPTVTAILVNDVPVDPPNRPNDGPQPSSWQDQQSTLQTIRIQFSEPVIVGLNDVTLTNLGVNAPDEADEVVALAPSQVLVDDSEVTLFFDEHVLGDGIYQLDVAASVRDAAGNALDGDADGQPGGDYSVTGEVSNGLYQLTADFNGDGGVSIFDFGVFAYWFGTVVGVAPSYVDLNGDLGVSIFDFSLFADQFGQVVVAPAKSAAGDTAKPTPDSQESSVALDRMIPSWTHAGDLRRSPEPADGLHGLQRNPRATRHDLALAELLQEI